MASASDGFVRAVLFGAGEVAETSSADTLGKCQARREKAAPRV